MIDDGALAGHARDAIDARLDAQTLRRAPASIAAVVRDGRVVAARAHGEPRRDGSPATESTVFRIASMSKSFLAATALALRDDGLLDLHAPASEYVPELVSAPFGDDETELTLDALLANRAGLAEDNAWGDRRLGAPREELAAIVAAGLWPATRPETAYEYSNLGISLIGRAIERVTGRLVEDVIRERMLDRLGLRDTRAEAGLYPAGTDLAAGYRTFDDGATFVPEPYVGTGALGCIGSLFSTVGDIARWAHFLGSAFGDAPHAVDVLSASSRRRMQTAGTLIPTGSGALADRGLDGAGYGYGLVIEHGRRFGRVVQHAGGLPGFSSHMRWHPTTGIGVVVFGNTDAFGAGGIAADLLTDVLTRADAPAAVVHPWPETVAAARGIDALLTAGLPLDAGDVPLADSVLLDLPAPVRAERLAAALSESGEILPDAPDLGERILSAADRSRLRWRIPCERGALICDVHLVGLHAPLVQEFSLEVADASGTKPRGERPMVTDHHRVSLG